MVSGAHIPALNSCMGCGGLIEDRYYLHTAEGQWHAHCLACHRCKAPLDQAMSCFFRDGHVYCKEDYYRLFAVRRCSRCQHGIYASELVMRARDQVYHLHCFTCAWCNSALTQGDLFGIRDNLVYCRTHYEGEATRNYYEPPQDLEKPTPPVFFGGGRKGRPRKKKNGEMAGESRHTTGLTSLDPCGLHLSHLDVANSSQSSPPLSSGQRTKRMRTSFKHHQLRTMKSYFAINQNPDAKDLKQLAQKTGLSKRVLQVWFQNARAKWRRNNMKQEFMPGMMGSDQSPNSQLHQGGNINDGLCSPSGNSSYSEPSPVHSCNGIQSDGSLSTQMGPGVSMDLDNSNPLTPLVSHPGLSGGSVHSGESMLHMTSFHEIF